MFLTGCSKNDGSIPGWPWYDDTDPDEWIDVSDKFGKLPEYVKVYSADQTKSMKGRMPVAYIATVDASKASFKVWGLEDPTLQGSSDALRTPTEIYNTMDSPTIVMNGGYFYVDSNINYPSSLAMNDGHLFSPNINYSSLDWVSIYYPTRAVFVEHTDGTYEAAWTYWADSDHHYLYQEPAHNSYASEPLAQPSADFPEGAEIFSAKTAIGAGPVLIKDGVIRNTYTYELFQETEDVGVKITNPRSAIGITDDNRLVFFVCEGRNMTEDVPGYTTEEVAKILLSFGCVEAINLDGGGSSCLLINGIETIQPSDGKQRSVGSLIYVK